MPMSLLSNSICWVPPLHNRTWSRWASIWNPCFHACEETLRHSDILLPNQSNFCQNLRNSVPWYYCSWCAAVRCSASRVCPCQHGSRRRKTTGSTLWEEFSCSNTFFNPRPPRELSRCHTMAFPSSRNCGAANNRLTDYRYSCSSCLISITWLVHWRLDVHVFAGNSWVST